VHCVCNYRAAKTCAIFVYYCTVHYVQFVKLQTLDLSGNHITCVDNLHANKVLYMSVYNVLSSEVSKRCGDGAGYTIKE